jgi:hypothetical protein
MSLGYSLVHRNNQVLQPNLAGGANPSGAHLADPIPQFSSKMETLSGCGGAGGSAAALAGNPGYNVVQSGGRSHRRGGNKRSSHKRSGHKRSSHKRSSHKRSGHKRSGHKRRQIGCKRRRSMRGGLNALSPSSFSDAANLPYSQFGNQPMSFGYGLGSATALPPNLIGMASPPPMMIRNSCGSDYGLVNSKLLN